MDNFRGVLAFLAFLPTVVAAQQTSDVRAAIPAVLNDSVAAWNRGDVGRFVAISYENSPDTAFVTQHGLIKGYAAIAQRYAESYGKRAGGPGRLSFGDLSVRSLTPDYAMVYGTYRLILANGGKPQEGIFDLLFHRSRAGWRIVSDHTS